MTPSLRTSCIILNTIAWTLLAVSGWVNYAVYAGKINPPQCVQDPFEPVKGTK